MTTSGGPATPWPQEIRLAMTMVGGASLAVWMGGIASETSQLLHDSRGESREKGPYRPLLDLLRVTVSLDVLTGTSAGGINAACLGLAEAFGSTPEVLRDTWIETGALDKLIRDPSEPQPRSLLDGDGVLLAGVHDALGKIIDAGRQPATAPDVTVLLTGTMIDGETTRFDDALGNLVRDTEHRLLFRFEGDAWSRAVQAPLALAARSTASFPGVFELSRMPIGKDCADDLHPDMTAYTDATRSHWLTDGGVLLNKPLQPALREIFERGSHADVRRLLLYVVPTAEPEVDEVAVDVANPPLLGSAMAKVVSTVLNQTISAELDELNRHNEAVAYTRDTRVSLAAIGLRGTPAQLVDARLMEDYLDRRVAEDVGELVRAARRCYQSIVDDPRWVSGKSVQLHAAAVKGLKTGLPEAAPGDTITAADAAKYRSTAFDDAVAIGLQLVHAGFRLRPTAEQAAQLNACRGKLHDARRSAARTERLAAWVAKQAVPDDPQVPGKKKPLDVWIGELATSWVQSNPASKLEEAWPKLVGALREAAPTLRALATEQAGDVTTLLQWAALEGGEDGATTARLLTLHIATRGLFAQTPPIDQPVDLVQVSADSRSLLDMRRTRAQDKLTGMQAGYFGAFYKASWRANDWMWGRVDGAGWLMQCLLQPDRLCTLRDLLGPENFRAEVVKTFKELGWRKPGAADQLSTQDSDNLNEKLKDELAFLGLDADLGSVEFAETAPAGLPVTSMVLARPRQAQIACEELPEVASQCGSDAARGNGKPSASFRSVVKDKVDVGDAQHAFQACQVSGERIGGERGSELLTRTVVKTGAAGLNAAAGAARVPKSVQPAVAFSRATGRSAWWVTDGAGRLGRPWNLLVTAITLVAGLVLGGQGGPVLQWAGVPVVAGSLVFLLVSLITLRRTGKMMLTVLVVLVVAALLFAAFLPPIAQPLFGWLGDVVGGWRQGHAPIWWLVVVAFLLLPALWTPVAAVFRRGHRAPPPAPDSKAGS